MKTKKQNSFFFEHLKESIMEEYSLSSEEFKGILLFLGTIGKDPKSMLREMNKRKNSSHLKKLLLQLYKKEVEVGSFPLTKI